MRGTVPYPSAIIENLFQASLALCRSLKKKKIVRQWTNYFTKNVIEWKINNPKTNVSHLLISHSFPTKIYAVLWDFFYFFLYVSKILHHHSSLYLFSIKGLTLNYWNATRKYFAKSKILTKSEGKYKQLACYYLLYFFSSRKSHKIIIFILVFIYFFP